MYNIVFADLIEIFVLPIRVPNAAYLLKLNTIQTSTPNQCRAITTSLVQRVECFDLVTAFNLNQIKFMECKKHRPSIGNFIKFKNVAVYRIIRHAPAQKVGSLLREVRSLLRQH